MKFYSGIEADLIVVGGSKEIILTDGIYETDVDSDIKLLAGQGYKYDGEIVEDKVEEIKVEEVKVEETKESIKEEYKKKK